MNNIAYLLTQAQFLDGDLNLKDNEKSSSSGSLNNSNEDLPSSSSSQKRLSSNSYTDIGQYFVDVDPDRIANFFGLSKIDLYSHHFCSLLQCVQLKGHLYITSQAICFVSSIKKSSHVLEGYIGKRKKLINHRYWFVLYQDRLTYYKHSMSKYMPLSTIPIKEIVAAEKEYSSPENAIYFLNTQTNTQSVPTLKIIRVNRKPLYLYFDSTQQLEEWHTALEWAILCEFSTKSPCFPVKTITSFLPTSSSSSLNASPTSYQKIVIPYDQIATISENLSSVLPNSITLSLQCGAQCILAMIDNQQVALSNMRNAWETYTKTATIRNLKNRKFPSHLENLLPTNNILDSFSSDSQSEHENHSNEEANMNSNNNTNNNNNSNHSGNNDNNNNNNNNNNQTFIESNIPNSPSSQIINTIGPLKYHRSLSSPDFVSFINTDTELPSDLSHLKKFSVTKTVEKSKFVKHFQLEQDEVVLKAHRVGYQSVSSIGILHITNRRLAFHLKGFVRSKNRQISIPFATICSIYVGTQSAVLTHAITITTIDGNEHCFHSFGNTQKAFKLLHHLWVEANPKGTPVLPPSSWKKRKSIGTSQDLYFEQLMNENSVRILNQIQSQDEQGDLQRLFKLPENEEVFGIRGCSLIRKVPVKGRVFLSNNFLCFKSSPLSPNRLVVIPLLSIESLNKDRSTLVLYYSIKVTTRDQRVFHFSGFSLKDEFYGKLCSQFDICHGLTQISNVEQSPLASCFGRVHSKRHSKTNSDLSSQSSSPKSTEQTEIIDKGDDTVSDSIFNEVNNFSIGPNEVCEKERSLVLRPQKEGNLSYEVQKPLRILILTIGSRGDIQPFIAFGLGLKKAGHHVIIGTHDEFKGFVTEHGLDFRCLRGNPKELMQLVVSNGIFTIKFMRAAVIKFRSFVENLLHDIWLISKDENLNAIIATPSVIAGRHIAEKLGIPLFGAFTMPWSRTSWFPHPFAVPDHAIGKRYNYFSYLMVEQMFWHPVRDIVNKWRGEELGLTPIGLGSGGHQSITRSGTPFLYCFSKYVVPKPPDWEDWIVPCGYWFLDTDFSNWVPPSDLVDFLNSGPAPIYIGFGSIIVDDPIGLTKTVLKAIEETGQRAILGKGWANMENESFPPNVFPIDSVPHDWLFPQVSLVCHHGGAGTVAAGLRYGLPTVIVAFFGDQYFWGQIVKDIGVGTSLSYKGLTSKKLSNAILHCIEDKQVQLRAQKIGMEIGSEDGVQTAVDTFHKYFKENTSNK